MHLVICDVAEATRPKVCYIPERRPSVKVRVTEQRGVGPFNQIVIRNLGPPYWIEPTEHRVRVWSVGSQQIEELEKIRVIPRCVAETNLFIKHKGRIPGFKNWRDYRQVRGQHLAQ